MELGVKLRGERLVRRDDESGAVDFRDDVGHREGLAAAGNAEERLALEALLKAVGQLLDSAGLVALRHEGSCQFELRHNGILAGFERFNNGGLNPTGFETNMQFCAPIGR